MDLEKYPVFNNILKNKNKQQVQSPAQQQAQNAQNPVKTQSVNKQDPESQRAFSNIKTALNMLKQFGKGSNTYDAGRYNEARRTLKSYGINPGNDELNGSVSDNTIWYYVGLYMQGKKHNGKDALQTDGFRSGYNPLSLGNKQNPAYYRRNIVAFKDLAGKGNGTFENGREDVVKLSAAIKQFHDDPNLCSEQETVNNFNEGATNIMNRMQQSMSEQTGNTGSSGMYAAGVILEFLGKTSMNIYNGQVTMTGPLMFKDEYIKDWFAQNGITSTDKDLRTALLNAAYAAHNAGKISLGDKAERKTNKSIIAEKPTVVDNSIEDVSF